MARRKTRHQLLSKPKKGKSEILNDVDQTFSATKRNVNTYNTGQCEEIGQNCSSHTKHISIDSFCVNIFNRLHEMQKAGQFCDVKLNAKTGFVMAHRLVLQAASPYFYEHLQQNTHSRGNCQSLNLKHIPVDFLNQITSFIYSGKIQVLQNHIYQLAEFCQSVGLKTLFDRLMCEAAGTDSETFSSGQTAVVKCRGNFTEPKQEVTVSDDVSADCSLNSELLDNTVNCTSDSTSRCNRNSKMLKRRNCKGNKTDDCFVSKTQSSDNATNLIQHEGVYNDTTAKESSTVEDTLHIEMDNEPHDKSLEVSYLLLNKTEDIKDQHGQCKTEYDDTDQDCISDFIPNENILKVNKSTLQSSVSLKTGPKVRIKPNLICKKCKEIFLTSDERIIHTRNCTGNRQRRRCRLCQVSFSTTEEYLHHRNTDVNCVQRRRETHKKRLQKKALLKSRFACNVCPRKFRRAVDQIDHEFTAHDLPYDKEQWPDLICEWCAYQTMNPWRLHHHKTYDCSQGKEYICDVCGNNYKNEKTLKLHKETVHSDVLPMLPCEQCGKTLKGPKGLKYHIRIMHSGGSPHKRHMCHMCSKKYSSPNDLTFHLYRVHDQPLPEDFVVFTCPECGYVINHKRVFNQHMSLHEDKRNFNCDQCEKSFKTRNSLQTHLKSHEGVKIPCPYEICNYKALKKSHLKTHIENKHTKKGMKNEKCHVCSYSTFFRGNLMKHLRGVHQLEVVTRYNVQMKAKYKHLKSGDIVGEAQCESEKKAKNVDISNVDDEIHEFDSNQRNQNIITAHQNPCTANHSDRGLPMTSQMERPAWSENNTNRQLSGTLSSKTHFTAPYPTPLVIDQSKSLSVVSNSTGAFPGFGGQTYFTSQMNNTLDLSTSAGSQRLLRTPGNSVHYEYSKGLMGVRDEGVASQGLTEVDRTGVFQESHGNDDVSEGVKMLTYTQI